MPGATDQMFARLQSELEERRSFQDGLVAAANEQNRDLNAQEMELFTRAQTRESEIVSQMAPLAESTRIGLESAARTQQLTDLFAMARPNNMGGGNAAPEIEYRSAGSYISDLIRAQAMRDHDAANRIEMFHRAAAHQTTADNPGLLPERLLGTILGDLDTARPLVTAVGPQQLPTGSWSRPRITQHTQVAKQTGEKTELASRKLILGKVPIEADTFGGYLNVSRQNIDWSQPQVLDIVIKDLTNEYGFETEEEAGNVFLAAATAGPALPATPTAGDWSGALWAAAGTVFSAMWTKRQPVGRLVIAVSPDMLGLIGPLFPPFNPQNSQSSGMLASMFGEGGQGQVAGITHTVSGSLPTGTALVISTNAAEVYEDRIGALQVVEPSVLGTQVAYAGYFTALVLEPTGIVKITKSGA